MNTVELHELAKKIAPLIDYEYHAADNGIGELHWLATERPRPVFGLFLLWHRHERRKVTVNSATNIRVDVNVSLEKAEKIIEFAKSLETS